MLDAPRAAPYMTRYHAKEPSHRLPWLAEHQRSAVAWASRLPAAPSPPELAVHARVCSSFRLAQRRNQNQVSSTILPAEG